MIVRVIFCVDESLLLNKKRMDPEAGRPFANKKVPQGTSPTPYEVEVVRMVDPQEIERFTPSIKLPDHESVYGAPEGVLVAVPDMLSTGSVTVVTET